MRGGREHGRARVYDLNSATSVGWYLLVHVRRVGCVHNPRARPAASPNRAPRPRAPARAPPHTRPSLLKVTKPWSEGCCWDQANDMCRNSGRRIVNRLLNFRSELARTIAHATPCTYV